MYTCVAVACEILGLNISMLTVTMWRNKLENYKLQMKKVRSEGQDVYRMENPILILICSLSIE